MILHDSDEESYSDDEDFTSASEKESGEMYSFDGEKGDLNSQTSVASSGNKKVDDDRIEHFVEVPYDSELKQLDSTGYKSNFQSSGNVLGNENGQHNIFRRDCGQFDIVSSLEETRNNYSTNAYTTDKSIDSEREIKVHSWRAVSQQSPSVDGEKEELYSPLSEASSEIHNDDDMERSFVEVQYSSEIKRVHSVDDEKTFQRSHKIKDNEYEQQRVTPRGDSQYDIEEFQADMKEKDVPNVCGSEESFNSERKNLVYSLGWCQHELQPRSHPLDGEKENLPSTILETSSGKENENDGNDDTLQTFMQVQYHSEVKRHETAGDKSSIQYRQEVDANVNNEHIDSLRAAYQEVMKERGVPNTACTEKSINSESKIQVYSWRSNQLRLEPASPPRPSQTAPSTVRHVNLASKSSAGKLSNSKKHATLSRYSRHRLDELAEPTKYNIFKKTQRNSTKTIDYQRKNMGSQSIDNPQDQTINFLNRMQSMAKKRKEKLDRAAAEAVYNAKVDKLVCPNCGSAQSFSEMVQGRTACRNIECDNVTFQPAKRFVMKHFQKRMERSSQRRIKVLQKLEDEMKSSMFEKAVKKSQRQQELMNKISKEGNDFMARMERDVQVRKDKIYHLEERADEELIKTCTFKPSLSMLVVKSLK